VSEQGTASASRPASRRDVRFPSGGEHCGAWLYPAPESDGRAPCVVMAHGFGAVKEGRLDAYAERFQAAGLAALVFDYRHFGASDGEPRQLLDIKRQLADWASAVGYARTLDGVDPERIAIWGSSFAGGHVIAVAARDPSIAAVIAQVPHTSGPATARAGGPLAGLRLTSAALRDLLASRGGRGPRYVKTVGPPGSLAAMTSPDADPGYRAMYPPELDWRDEVAARIFLSTPRYSPGRQAKRVRCPLLVQVGEHDAVTPSAPAVRAARRAPQGELITYPIGHFDIYVGEPFERAVADQIAFLERHLRPTRRAEVST
jgi:fermentation-respiration switch protein FrsA (DUF1100 family)